MFQKLIFYISKQVVPTLRRVFETLPQSHVLSTANTPFYLSTTSLSFNWAAIIKFWHILHFTGILPKSIHVFELSLPRCDQILSYDIRWKWFQKFIGITFEKCTQFLSETVFSRFHCISRLSLWKCLRIWCHVTRSPSLLREALLGNIL